MSSNKNNLSRVKNALRNGAFVFIFLLGIEAFTFKIPYCIVMGVLLISTSLLFFPWLDKICNMINVKLNIKNKWFIGVVNLFVAAYLIKPEETNYYKCILPIILMTFVWIITIFYSKIKRAN